MDFHSSRDGDGLPIGWVLRSTLITWSLLLIAGFALAAYLKPSPQGYGTHQQLGLPECTFRTMFGIGCPSCGMTTSFSNFVRGRFLQAARANVAGLFLATLCAVQIPWCWISVCKGRLWKVERPDVAVMWLVVSIILITSGQWIARLVLE